MAFLRRLARRTPDIIGSPYAFLIAVGLTAGWLLTGPLFDFSEGWVLWPATVSSVVTFLIVFLLQYSQNRDTRALQLKLDELIRGLGEARTHLVRLEHMTDEELEEIEREFSALREEQRRDA